jgi:hypothetical protein
MMEVRFSVVAAALLVATACGDDGAPEGTGIDSLGPGDATGADATGPGGPDGGDDSGGSGDDTMGVGDTASDDGDPEPEPMPDGASLGPVADHGVPFDPNGDFYGGPATLLPDGIPRLVPVANPNGSIDVAWLDTTSPRITVSHLVPAAGAWEVAWHWEVPTLDRLGGYARDAAGDRYVLTTLDENALLTNPAPSGQHRDGIARISRFDASGAEVFATDLRTDVSGAVDPLVAPMAFGTGRIAVGGGTVAATLSCLTEYDGALSSRHQRQCFFLVDGDAGTLLDHVPGPGHSWEHRIVYDGDRFVATIHGDAGLRGVGVASYDRVGGYLDRVAFAAKGGDATTGGAYQNTFSRAGNLVPTAQGYAMVFATEHVPTYTGAQVLASRNLVFVHIRPDFASTAALANPYDVQIVDTSTANPLAADFTVPIVDYWGSAYEGHNRGLVWLTDHADPAGTHVESTKLSQLDSGQLVVLWEQWTASSFSALMGMVVDEFGNVVVPAQALGDGRIYRGDDPVSLGDRAAWVVGDADVPQLVLYTVDASLTLQRHDLP